MFEEISSAVRRALSLKGIPFGENVVITDQSRNITLNDGKVFVKVTRPGWDSEPLEREVYFTSKTGLSLAAPLQHEALNVDSHLISVWESLPMKELKPQEISSSNAEDLALGLKKIHTTEHNLELPLKTKDSYHSEARNFFATKDKWVVDLDSRRSSLLKEMIEVFYEDDVFKNNFHSDSVIHGDAYYWNMAKIGDKAFWVDFENVSYGPAVWDLATVSLSTRRSGNEEAWAHFIATYGDVDENIVEVFERAAVTGATAWLLTRDGAQEKVEWRIDSMEKTLETGIMPTYFRLR